MFNSAAVITILLLSSILSATGETEKKLLDTQNNGTNVYLIRRMDPFLARQSWDFFNRNNEQQVKERQERLQKNRRIRDKRDQSLERKIFRKRVMRFMRNVFIQWRANITIQNGCVCHRESSNYDKFY